MTERPMTVFSVRIDPELKRKMEELRQVNWSEIVRMFLEDRVRTESRARNIDMQRRKSAIELSRTLQAKYEPSQSWNSTEELRKWREYHR